MFLFRCPQYFSTEPFTGLGDEGGGLIGARDGDNGCWGVNEKSLISCFFRAKI